jgi:hypothetical protein
MGDLTSTIEPSYGTARNRVIHADNGIDYDHASDQGYDCG